MPLVLYLLRMTLVLRHTPIVSVSSALFQRLSEGPVEGRFRVRPAPPLTPAAAFRPIIIISLTTMPEFQPRVLVTGGGLGIGCASVRFLLEKYNARVVVFTLDYGAELEELLKLYEALGRIFLLTGDVTNVGGAWPGSSRG